MKIINLQGGRRHQLYVGILLFINIQTVVASESCPDNCHCDYDHFYRNATCSFRNSTINITTRLWDTTLSTSINCHGTMSSRSRDYYSSECYSLPRIEDTSRSHAEVKVISCDWSVLQCIDPLFMNVFIILVASLAIQDVVLTDDDETTPIFFVTFIKKLQVITTDDNMESPIYLIYKIFQVQNYEFVGGKVNASNIDSSNNMNSAISLTLRNNIITSLAFENTLSKNLNTLNIINSNIESISANMINDLDFIQSLTLKDNKKLISIETEAISKLKNLRYLRIAGCSIESLPEGMFDQLSRLSEVIIEKNMKGIILGNKLFANLLVMKSLKITESKINILPKDIMFRLSSLTHLDLADNMIENVPEKLLWTDESIRNITLKSNKIIMIPHYFLLKAMYIEYIDLRDNHIIELSSMLFYATTASMQLLLDDNKIKVLNLDVYQGTNFVYLSVTSNHIESLTSNNLDSLQIEDLNLSNNRISTFEHWWLNINKLEKLNLSSNNIMTINESALYMPYRKEMMELDLRNNNISNIIINESLFRLSDQIKTRLYLSNNSLNCDCNVTRLLKDMRSRGTLVDYEDIICENNKKHLSHVYLHTLCDEKVKIINTIGVCAVATLVILLLILSIYAHRNKILNYIINIMNCDKNDLTAQEIRQDSKQFDVFVSFAHKDVEFVINILLPKLEIGFSQSVCIHSRDWRVGELIADQIIKSVESSRKTMIILTKHFLSSEWAMLEFQTAYTWSKQERASNVIVIVLDEAIVTDPQLPDIIKTYIINNGYLCFKDYNFWVKLQNILPRRGKKSKKHPK